MTYDDSLWRDMRRMQHRMDKMVRGMWDRPFRVASEEEDEKFTRPRNFRKAFTDFEETDNAFILRVELPGIQKEDITLDITDQGLEIHAENKDEVREDEPERKSIRRSFAGFYQRITLPENADSATIDAEYREGILTIRVQKTPADKKRREVRIK